MVVIAILAAIVAAVIALALAGSLPSLQKGPGAAIAAELKDLLTARAEGRIDAETFERSQAALHARLIEAPSGAAPALRRHLAWAMPVLVAALAGALYGMLPPAEKESAPAPQAVSAKPAAPPPNAQAGSGGDLNTLVRRLADKMAKDPGNGEGWLLLARTYGELRQFREAAEAYARADALLPPDASLLADWTDAHIMSHERKWDAKARSIVKKALAADAGHIKSLALAGSEAFERADYKAAIGYWKRMKEQAPPDSMDAKLAETNIAEATALMTGKKPAGPRQEAAPAGIAGTVVLDAKLKAEVSSADTVFVVAKAPDGKGFPLAVKRYTAGELPVGFRIGDGDAMMPGRTLSKFGEVLLSARVSKSGNASPQPGDIVSEDQRVGNGTAGVRLELRGKL